MKKIDIEYEEANDKYYLYINGEMKGKHYTFLSLIAGMIREYEFEEYKKKSRSTK